MHQETQVNELQRQAAATLQTLNQQGSFAACLSIDRSENPWHVVQLDHQVLKQQYSQRTDVYLPGVSRDGRTHITGENSRQKFSAKILRARRRP